MHWKEGEMLHSTRLPLWALFQTERKGKWGYYGAPIASCVQQLTVEHSQRQSSSKASVGTTVQQRWSPPPWTVFEKEKSKQICRVKWSSSVTRVRKSKGTKMPYTKL